jgi:hypothetical protein
MYFYQMNKDLLLLLQRGEAGGKLGRGDNCPLEKKYL